MNKFKLNILQAFILLFSLATFVTSCTSDSSETQVEEAVVENLNTSANRQAVKDLFSNQKLLNKTISEFKTFNAKNSNSEEVNLNDVDFDLMLNEYSACSTCPNEYKGFLTPFFQEIVETNDDQVLAKVQEYELLIDNSNLSETHKENLRFTLFSFQEASNYALNSSDYQKFASKENSPGKNIGRGLAWGFLTGCATGAYIGGTVGTVTVPVLGTAVGAVAGCIYGGAFTGSMGAIGAGFWSAVDSIF
jgi:hypothetical protein